MKVGFIGGKFLPFHNGHLYATMEAYNYVDKLYVIVFSSPIRDRILCQRDGIKYMPGDIRCSCISEELNDFPNIEVLNIEDQCSEKEEEYDWDEGAMFVKARIPETITHVFSSEPSYDKYFAKNYPTAEHIVIDESRKTVPISATAIRQNVFANWEYLPRSVRQFFTKRVCIIGPESGGKSTLTKQLAKVYGTNYCHEVGRDYCDRYKNNLTPPMFDEIAMDHWKLQNKLAYDSNKVLFVDSEAVITQFYLDMYCGVKSDFISSIIQKQHFDLLLFLEPDVPWVDDGIRFHAEDKIRKADSEKLKCMFESYGYEFICIQGTYIQRFKQAIRIVDSMVYSER